MEFGFLRLMGLIFFGALDISLAMYDRYYGTHKNKTSYSAHFMGALTGFLLGIVVLRNLKVRRWEIILGYVTIAVFILLLGMCIIWNAVYDSYFPNPI